MDYPFRYKNNQLYCENVNIRDFSASVTSPFFIYSKAELEHSCDLVWQAAGNNDFLPCYALKANYNPALLAIIRDKGFGADIVSGGELDFALRSGFDPEKIVFAGVGKDDFEIEKALQHNIHSLNIESAQEMDVLAQIAARMNTTVTLAIRVNPDIDAQTHEYISTGMHRNKFGVSRDEALRLYEKAHQHPNLEPAGIHIHLGSQMEHEEPFRKAAGFLKEFSGQLAHMGIKLRFLDIGGGIGINYTDALLNPQKPRSYVPKILPGFIRALSDAGLPLVAELGRSIVGSAGLLVSRVLYRKQTPQKNFIIVDAAMNNLIRPGLYKAFHEVAPLVKKDGTEETVDVVGPVCESTDFLAQNRVLQQMKRGDYLAFGGAGAYGQALSSHYNLRPMISEYLVDGDSVKCIFKGISVEQLADQYGADIWDQPKRS